MQNFGSNKNMPKQTTGSKNGRKPYKERDPGGLVLLQDTMATNEEATKGVEGGEGAY